MVKKELVYYEYAGKKGVGKNVVLGSPAHESPNKDHKLMVVYSNAPQSLRDVEESTGFKV